MGQERYGLGFGEAPIGGEGFVFAAHGEVLEEVGWDEVLVYEEGQELVVAFGDAVFIAEVFISVVDVGLKLV